MRHCSAVAYRGFVCCGTKWTLSALEVIREKGLEHVSVETLVTEMTQFARSSVPESVKRELLQEIRDFVQSQQ